MIIKLDIRLFYFIDWIFFRWLNTETFTAAVKDPVSRKLGGVSISRTTSAKRGIVTSLYFFLNYNYILTYEF